MTRKQSMLGKGRNTHGGTRHEFLEEVEADLDAMASGAAPATEASDTVAEEAESLFDMEPKAEQDPEYDSSEGDGEEGPSDDPTDDVDQEQATSRGRRGRSPERIGAHGQAGSVALFLGTVTTILGAFALAIGQLAPDSNLALRLSGLLPSAGPIVVIGLAWLSLTIMLRRTIRQGTSIDALTDALSESRATSLRIEDALASLGGRQTTSTGSGDELGHVMLALQRQDEKTNNLTRAIKMYGQPLIEITNQVTESGTRLREMDGRFDGLKTSFDSRITRMETSLRSELERVGSQHPSLQKELADLSESLQKLLTSAETGTKQAKELDARTRGIEDHTRELEVRSREMDGRTRDIDSRSKEIESRARTLEERLGRLEESVSRFSTSLSTSIDKLAGNQGGDGKVGDAISTLEKSLERGLQQLRTDVSGIVAQVQRSAPAATQTSSEPSRPAPAPQKAAPLATAETGPAGSLAQSIAGTKSEGGKNVMSAIAKLRQMKNG